MTDSPVIVLRRVAQELGCEPDAIERTLGEIYEREIPVAQNSEERIDTIRRVIGVGEGRSIIRRVTRLGKEWREVNKR